MHTCSSFAFPPGLVTKWSQWRLKKRQVTRGLGLASNTISDNLNAQEPTNQDPADMGPDGPGLSCSGSSVVADEDDG
jgi:hypothetical protein